MLWLAVMQHIWLIVAVDHVTRDSLCVAICYITCVTDFCSVALTSAVLLSHVWLTLAVLMLPSDHFTCVTDFGCVIVPHVWLILAVLLLLGHMCDWFRQCWCCHLIISHVWVTLAVFLCHLTCVTPLWLCCCCVTFVTVTLLVQCDVWDSLWHRTIFYSVTCVTVINFVGCHVWLAVTVLV